MESQAAAMVERAVAFGKLDMAFNNAGILGPEASRASMTASNAPTTTALGES